MSENTNATVEFANLTPYAAAQVATRVLGTEIQPQTMYGLARRNAIETTEGALKGDGTHKILFVGNSFKTWLDEQLLNPGGGVGRTDYDALAAEFSASVSAPAAVEAE
jgi:hypothetical protein